MQIEIDYTRNDDTNPISPPKTNPYTFAINLKSSQIALYIGFWELFIFFDIFNILQFYAVLQQIVVKFCCNKIFDNFKGF